MPARPIPSRRPRSGVTVSSGPSAAPSAPERAAFDSNSRQCFVEADEAAKAFAHSSCLTCHRSPRPRIRRCGGAMIAGPTPALSLDVPTLAFVSIALAGLLGVFLVISWVQDRNVPSLAWWGSAYLIGASSVALWLAPAPRFHIPPEVPEAMTLLACGVVWSGIRLFHGRTLKPLVAFAGAIAWPVLCDLPGVAEGSDARMGLGAALVAAYTFVIAFELWRERRKSLFSRTAAIVVPSLHAAIFLMPLAMQAFMPDQVAAQWLTVFALETMIYAVGTAFIMMLMVKDHHVYVYRRAATTDHLTGLPNRRAFLQDATTLCVLQARKRQPVTLMMFDLD